MSTRVAINGFGRIGRSAFKVAFERDDIEVVAINDLTDDHTLAYLLQYDTNYGTYDKKVTADESHIVVEDMKIPVFAEKDPLKLPWKDLEVDVVIESTGHFTKTEDAKKHIQAGAKKVVISAPTKSVDADTFVLGVNNEKLQNSTVVVSNGSCTTNNITPVAAIIENHFGIEKAMMTTIHSLTSESNVLVDSPGGKDMRTNRAGPENIIPTTTGATISAAQAMPSLSGIFDGLSIRVPTPIVSLSDFILITKRDVTVEEVNDAFKKEAAKDEWQGILSVTEEPLVSSDFIGNSHSAIVDLNLTKVVGGNMLKVVAWYDNEWGYSNRLVELVADLGKFISVSNK